MLLSKRSFLLSVVSLSCFSLQPLLATTSVTSSAASGPGTLSAAIDAVNSSSSSSPIEIEEGVIPTLTNTPFPTITTSLTIASDTPGQLRAINGNSVSKALSFSSGTSTLTTDTTLIKTPVFITGSGTDVTLGSAPIFHSPIQVVEGATLTLSGDNRRARQDITVDSTSTLILSEQIRADSVSKIAGTLNATATTSISVQCDEACTINATDNTTTLTLPILSQTKSSTVSLTGDGAISVRNIEIKPKSTMTIDGPMGGTHDLSIGGAGILILTGESSYLGHTTIGESSTDTAKLIVEASGQIGTTSHDIRILPQAFFQADGTIFARTITNDGLMQGTGEITCVGILNNGILHPGHSPGLLHITGAVVEASGSTLSVSITPTEAAELEIFGSLDIRNNATLLIDPISACYDKTTTEYTIVSAGGGVNGTFSNVVSPPILSTKITYTPTTILLSVSRASINSLPLDANAKAVGKVIENWIDSGNTHLCTEIGKLTVFSLSELNALLDELQPSLFKGLTVGQENNAVKVQDALSYRNQVELNSLHCHPVHSSKQTNTDDCDLKNRSFQLWAAGIGDALHQSNTRYAGSYQIGYQENTGGGVLGFDYRFTDYLYAGVLGAYTSSDIKWNDHRGKGSTETGYGGIYLSAIGDLFYGNASVMGAWSHYHAKRNIYWPDVSYTAQNSHGGAQLLSHLDTGINLGFGGFTIRPFDSFDYISQTEHSYTETGAGTLNLHVKKSNAILLRNELGLNFAFCMCKRGNKWILAPKISWVREVRIKGATSTAKFTDFDETFVVTGQFPDRSLISPGLSLTGVILDERLVVGIYYNGVLRGNYSDHSYGGELRLSF